jgi:hypothetical protein
MAPKPPATTKQPAVAKHAVSRTPDFVVGGAPKEPSDEMPLAQRAKLLAGFIASHRKSAANVRHFLYQNSWIVTGARFGWWHGAEALRDLIAADQAAQDRWGLGRKSELVARAALAEVEARNK